MSLESDSQSADHTGAGREDLSSLPDPDSYSAKDPDPIGNPDRSLLSDVEDIFFDAKTYFDAELNYQKTRAKFAGASLGGTIAFGTVGAVLGLVALIALSVGLIISLATIIGPLAATVVITLVLLLGVYLAIRRAKSAWDDFGEAVSERRKGDNEEQA